MFKLSQFKKSLTAARTGLRLVFLREQNFRFHCMAAIAVLGFAWLLRLSSLRIVVLCIVIAAVLSAEILNTVVEHFIDTIKPRLSPAVRDIKDMMAGFVLLVGIGALVIGLLLFIPPIVDLFYTIVAPSEL